MCSTYIIDGKRLHTGRDLAEAIGIENASTVNRNFIPDLPDEEWLDACLCHVNRAGLSRVVGTGFRHDWKRDAFVQVKRRKPFPT